MPERTFKAWALELWPDRRPAPGYPRNFLMKRHRGAEPQLALFQTFGQAADAGREVRTMTIPSLPRRVKVRVEYQGEA